MKHALASVKVLQAVMILTLDFVGTNNKFETWSVLAIITKAVVRLGNVENDTNSIESLLERLSIALTRAVTLEKPQE